MTTICFRDGVLAADSLIAYSTYTNGHRTKISECGDYLVAMCGPAFIRETLEDWVADGADPHSVPELLLDKADSFSALLVQRETGQVFEFDNGFLLEIFADYTAIGSGAHFAIGAMAFGATAREAVEAAARHDKNTGGPVSSRPYNA